MALLRLRSAPSQPRLALRRRGLPWRRSASASQSLSASATACTRRWRRSKRRSRARRRERAMQSQASRKYAQRGKGRWPSSLACVGSSTLRPRPPNGSTSRLPLSPAARRRLRSSSASCPRQRELRRAPAATASRCRRSASRCRMRLPLLVRSAREPRERLRICKLRQSSGRPSERRESTGRKAQRAWCWSSRSSSCRPARRWTHWRHRQWLRRSVKIASLARRRRLEPAWRRSGNVCAWRKSTGARSLKRRRLSFQLQMTRRGRSEAVRTSSSLPWMSQRRAVPRSWRRRSALCAPSSRRARRSWIVCARAAERSWRRKKPSSRTHDRFRACRA